MDELTREFLIESQEGLDRMERCLTELEERPQDASLIGDIFRSVHTIKGTTGFLGFKRLEKLAHSGENLLGLLREGKLTADRPTITGLLQLLDGLRSILKTIETQDSEGTGEDAALIERLEELQSPARAQAKHVVLTRAGTQEAQSATPSFAHSEEPTPLEVETPLAAPPAPQQPQHVAAAEKPAAAPPPDMPVKADGEAAKPRVPATGAARPRLPRRRARCASMWRCSTG